MSKAKTTSSTSKHDPDDAELLAMIKRLDALYRETDRLYHLGGDDATYTPEYVQALHEMTDLEYKITLWPVRTSAGKTAKLSFVKQYNDAVMSVLADAETVLAVILEMDAERVGAALRRSKKPAERIAAR